MNTDDQRKAYQNFFIKTEAGAAFVAEVDRIIVDCHEKAEKDADGSRDLVQQARGARRVKEHMNSVMAEGKKPIRK